MARSHDQDQVGRIYFITSHNQEACKIGFATDVYQRLKTLQTGNPEQLDLRISIPATLGAEMALHRLLAPRRIRLEWFWDRSDFMWLLEEHLDIFVAEKPPLIQYLTAADVQEQFEEFMEETGHRYSDDMTEEWLKKHAAYMEALSA